MQKASRSTSSRSQASLRRENSSPTWAVRHIYQNSSAPRPRRAVHGTTHRVCRLNSSFEVLSMQLRRSANWDSKNIATSSRCSTRHRLRSFPSRIPRCCRHLPRSKTSSPRRGSALRPSRSTRDRCAVYRPASRRSTICSQDSRSPISLFLRRALRSVKRRSHSISRARPR